MLDLSQIKERYLMWFLYLLGIVIALVIDYVIARRFADIAEMKGHEGNTYFWFTFLLGVVGMLMVIALPVETKDENHKTELHPAKDIWANVQVNAANAQATKRCPHCLEMVKVVSNKCEMCGKEIK